MLRTGAGLWTPTSSRHRRTPLIPPEYWLRPAARISLWMSPPSWYRTTFNSAAMPSLRHSYTVTVPEEPAAFPLDKHELQRKSPSLSRSKLVSTFMGLIINQAKVSPAPLHLCCCLTFTETPWDAFIMVTLVIYLFIYLFIWLICFREVFRSFQVKVISQGRNTLLQVLHLNSYCGKYAKWASIVLKSTTSKSAPHAKWLISE